MSERGTKETAIECVACYEVAAFKCLRCGAVLCEDQAERLDDIYVLAHEWTSASKVEPPKAEEK